MLVEAVKLSIRRSFSPVEKEKLRELLGHKGEPWLSHVEDFLELGLKGKRGGLEWRFYLASNAGKFIANICIWEYKGVGVLGHVYTRSEARGRGIAKKLLQFCLEDFDQRGSHWLQLNVEPDSFQQQLYAKFGFQQIGPLAGAMFRGQSDPVELNASTPLYCRAYQDSHLPLWNRFFLHANSSQYHHGFESDVPLSMEYHLIKCCQEKRLLAGASLMTSSGQVAAIGTIIQRSDGGKSFDLATDSRVPIKLQKKLQKCVVDHAIALGISGSFLENSPYIIKV